jgi:hypothetical protein
MTKKYKYFVVEDIPEDDCVIYSAMSIREAKRLRVKLAYEDRDGPALGITKWNGTIEDFENRAVLRAKNPKPIGI